MKTLFLILLCLAPTALAKVDLVTLPSRDTVQLTIYNSADLTLARENRSLTLKDGLNRLQVSWENTLIDPTSLAMLPQAQAAAIDVQELVYEEDIKKLARRIKSENKKLAVIPKETGGRMSSKR